MDRPEIILHHYERSPFAEKVRVAFGLKGLRWSSVLQPRIAPKPDLVPLTGGYRRIPVMQIGAEIYCDTKCILDELERRYPRPSLYPIESAGLADMVSAFADRILFAEALGLVFGLYGDRFPPELHLDRTRFTADLFDGWDSAKMKAKLPSLQYHFAHHLAWLDRSLSNGLPFLVGPAACVADLAAYHPLWYARENLAPPEFDLRQFPNLAAWMERLRALGHGHRVDLDPQGALENARGAEPEALPPNMVQSDERSWLGRSVRVTPDDWGFDPVEGKLVAMSESRITLLRNDPLVGRVSVHFPHLGFVVRRSHDQ